MDLYYLNDRQRRLRLQELQDRLAQATDEDSRNVIGSVYRVPSLEDLKEALKSVYDPSSNEYSDALQQLAAQNASSADLFFDDVQRDVVSVYRSYPAVWKLYVRMGGDPQLPAVPSLDPDWRVQKIAELI